MLPKNLVDFFGRSSGVNLINLKWTKHEKQWSVFMINDREAKGNFELQLKRTEEDRKQNNWFFFPFLCKWWLEVKSPIFVLLVKPESWTIFKSYTSDIDPILGNHPFPIISLLGRISIECLNKGIYDKEPIGTQLKKNHTAQSAGKRKWQVTIYSFESDW